MCAVRWDGFAANCSGSLVGFELITPAAGGCAVCASYGSGFGTGPGLESGTNSCEYAADADRGLQAVHAYTSRGSVSNRMTLAYHFGANTFAYRADSDQDGLPDGAEVKIYGSDPRNPDTDGDGFVDGYEVSSLHTSPTLVDTDGDGIGDWDEVE